MTDFRYRGNQAQQLFVQALSSAWRNGVQVYDVSTWLATDPEAEEKMLRDGDIAFAVDYRQSLVAGRQWDLQPRAKGSPRADVAIEVCRQLMSRIRRFSDARKILARAFFHGARFAKIHGTTRRERIGDGRERWWWFPTHLEDQDKRLFRIVPKNDGKQIDAHWERWDVAAGKWVPQTVHEQLHTIRHVYHDEQGTLGYGRALREALGWWWFAKANLFHESTQAAERFAQGIMHAKVEGARDAQTGLPNQTLINEWVRTLTNMRGRHVLVSDKADDVEVITGSGEGWQLMRDLRAELRTTIVTLVLCANLTTSADSGGSYALAETQENSTEALIQFDREALEETLTDQLIECIWWNNWANLVELGIADEKPRFNIKQEKKLDPNERADVATKLVGIGVDLAAEDVYEQTGFRKPQNGEEIIEGRSAPDPMQLGGFGAPGGGGSGLGDPLNASGLGDGLGFAKGSK